MFVAFKTFYKNIIGLSSIKTQAKANQKKKLVKTHAGDASGEKPLL